MTMRGPGQIQIGPCQGYLSSASTEIETCATAAVELQYALKGLQGGE